MSHKETIIAKIKEERPEYDIDTLREVYDLLEEYQRVAVTTEDMLSLLDADDTQY